MNVFNSLSLWIILATVIPGFVTIACLLLILKWVYALPEINFAGTGDLELAAFAISIMLITQLAGMLLEKGMLRFYTSPREKIKPEDSPLTQELGLDVQSYTPAKEYRQLYLVLAAMRSSDDPHGHVERTAAQFFMTNNMLASCFIAMLVLVFMSGVMPYTPRVLPAGGALLVLCLLTFFATRIRFSTMCRSIWVARQLLIRERKQNASM